MTRRFRENGCGLIVQYVVLKVYVKKYGVWLSLARAPGLGPGGRRFESCHPDLILYFYARVAQWWSTTLPRWGPRVRIPSRAFNFARFYRAFFVSCCISCCMAFSKTLYQPSGLRSLKSFMSSSGDRFSLSVAEAFSEFTMLSK